MSVYTFPSSKAIEERTAASYTVRFRGPDGVVLDTSAITGIRCTLRDVNTNIVINGREGESVLGEHGGTLAPSGLFTLALTADDHAIVPSAVTPLGSRLHWRRLTLEVTYRRGEGADALDQLHHEVTYPVVDLGDVPMPTEDAT